MLSTERLISRVLISFSDSMGSDSTQFSVYFSYEKQIFLWTLFWGHNWCHKNRKQNSELRIERKRWNGSYWTLRSTDYPPIDGINWTGIKWNDSPIFEYKILRPMNNTIEWDFGLQVKAFPQKSKTSIHLRTVLNTECNEILFYVSFCV